MLGNGHTELVVVDHGEDSRVCLSTLAADAGASASRPQVVSLP
jgi:hypothetical protein